MSKPIKDTPVLKGKAARRFDRITKENESKRVSKEEYERVMSNYRKLKEKLGDT